LGLLLIFISAIGSAARADMFIPPDLYQNAVAAGYWIIQGEVPGNGGVWYYCVDIGQATGSRGVGAQMEVYVPTGAGGWAWYNGTSFPCAGVLRTVQAGAPPPQPLGSVVPPNGGSGGVSGSGDGDLFNDLNRSPR